MMRFSQSADFCALLAGDAGAGFGSNPAVLGWAEPGGPAYSSRFASRMPELNLSSLYDFSQSFAWTAGTDLPTGVLADVGYLVTVGGILRAGAVLENLGRQVDGVQPVLVLAASGNGSRAAWLSYLDDPKYSLTPLTLSLGAALYHSWDAGSLHLLDASMAGSWTKRPGEGSDNHSFTTVAVHAIWLRSLGCQLGILHDPSSDELQGKVGVSLDLFNHVRITYVAIGATGGMELSDAQKGLSLSLSNLLRWQRGDWTWWRRVP